MDLRDAIGGRRATRAIMPDPVEMPVLLSLVDAAIRAPSAVNEQPWHFTIIENAALLDRIAAAAKKHVTDVMRGNSIPRHLQLELADPDFHILYRAPVMIVISAMAGGWAVENAAMAAQNLMLAAHAEGLGSCWIGFAQRWLRTEEGRVSIDLPEGFIPVAPIVLGYPAAASPPVPRETPRIHWIR